MVVDAEFLGAEDEAELVEWLVAHGDSVSLGQPIAALETNKASVELPSPGAGVIALLVKEGAVIEPGAIVARVS